MDINNAIRLYEYLLDQLTTKIAELEQFKEAGQTQISGEDFEYFHEMKQYQGGN